ncbi:hypothetical protein GCM10011495_33120 [Hymenobacter frigidus]|uniref:Uncharacterized protein n=1 Tax=Hymenobacter frigidus TaxID=1524095 RepID=A0ABQ2ABE9_9BACT|nr:hypothetical protein [Hymenobacter frigidus]GGH89462.1 hypothetical protein GCM10011495_33120 [Hymenobacter frigidus]
MKLPHTFAALLLALPLAATAQTTPPKTTAPVPTTTKTTAGTQQVTEVTEDLDPATGKVIRRTTRTTTLPAGTPMPGTPMPGTIGTTTTNAGTSNTDLADAKANDAQISSFLRRKTTVATLSPSALLSTYQSFIERVRNDRQNWKPVDWARAAAVMSSLNDRYEQLRSGFSLDDKLTLRSQQAEFQALRTARQISTQVSDKL